MREINGGSVEERVRKIVIEYLDVDPAKVTADASFIDDLGADSLDMVEMLMAAEEEFNIDIPDDQAENLQTFGQVVKYVTDKIGAPA